MLLIELNDDLHKIKNDKIRVQTLKLSQFSIKIYSKIQMPIVFNSIKKIKIVVTLKIIIFNVSLYSSFLELSTNLAALSKYTDDIDDEIIKSGIVKIL